MSAGSQQRKEDGSFRGWNVRVPVEKNELGEALSSEKFAKVVQRTVEKFSASSSARELLKGRNTNEFEKTLANAIARSIFEREKREKLGEHAATLGLANFMIYAPENTVLRTPPPESAILPLGTKGEGLLKLLQSFSDPKFSDRLADMKERLRLIGWFEDFLTPDDAATAQARLQIRDRWLTPEHAVFDQRSANEGFLYLLFYFTLFVSWHTPRFFALDNLDNALNPKLCSALMRQIAELAKKYDKQVICTTHNPAILDGLNINDDEQRLYTVQRDVDGHTVVHRVRPPKPQPDKIPMKLSTAFSCWAHRRIAGPFLNTEMSGYTGDFALVCEGVDGAMRCSRTSCSGISKTNLAPRASRDGSRTATPRVKRCGSSSGVGKMRGREAVRNHRPGGSLRVRRATDFRHLRSRHRVLAASVVGNGQKGRENNRMPANSRRGHLPGRTRRPLIVRTRGCRVAKMLRGAIGNRWICSLKGRRILALQYFLESWINGRSCL